MEGDLDILNAEVDETTHHIKLNTGYQAIDPNHIVIPFRQQVAVTFMYEGGAYQQSDFGWMLAGDGTAPDQLANPEYHEVFTNINDNLPVYADGSGDGELDDGQDKRKILGTFDAGTELVFWLRVDDEDYRNGSVVDLLLPSATVYHYTKTDWMRSIYTSREEIGDGSGSCPRNPDPLIKTYKLNDDRLAADNTCQEESGWMDHAARIRARDDFNLIFQDSDRASLTIPWDDKWPAVVVGAPGNNLNAWLLGFEDRVGGGDTDHNDLIFIIERETGGEVALKPEKAIKSETTDSNITGVTIGVWDQMPGDACAGQTEIAYWLSIDKGENWVEVDGWDEVYRFELQDGQKILLNPVEQLESRQPGLHLPHPADGLYRGERQRPRADLARGVKKPQGGLRARNH